MNSSLTLWEGCKLSLLKAKHDFMAGVDFVNEVISDANSRFSSDDEKSKREFLIESAFLRMFIYWESFIEKTFVCYLTKNLGDDFDVDSCPQSYAQAIDEIHANSLLIGQGSFVNWSKSDSVSKLAKAFFYEGAPYQTSLSSINSTLSHLSKIRNNTAHISSTTRSQFVAVITKTFNGHHTHDECSVSEFLMLSYPSEPSKTILQKYQEQLLAAAHVISTCEGT